MSLSKIGNLTKSLKDFKAGESINSTISSLKDFGDLNKAAKYMTTSGSDLPEQTALWLLQQAYGQTQDKDTIKEAFKKATKKTSIIGFLTGDLEGTGEKGGTLLSGIGSVIKSIAPQLILSAGIAAASAGWSFLDNQFNLTKGTTAKKYENAKEKHETAQQDLETAKSEYNSNQERIQELRAKENRTLSESQELNQLQDQNDLLEAQVSLKERLEKSARDAKADAANVDLNKKSMQQDYFSDGTGNYNPQAKLYVNDMDEAQAMIDYVQHLQDRYDTAKDRMIKRRGGEDNLTEEDLDTLDKQQKSIDEQKSKLSDKISGISESAQSLVGEDGKVDKRYQDTFNKVNSIIDNYSNLVGSASGTESDLKNLFALADYTDLQSKLESIGKSKGSQGILDALSGDDTYSALSTALKDKGISTDDLASYIMAIADPEALNLEGVKQNLKDELGFIKESKKSKKSYIDSFFADKSDKDIEGFWDYYQSQGLNAKENNWKKKDIDSNWEAYLKSKENTPEESQSFSSLFKNATEDTATDIDTVTDNFQSSISSIKSAMDSLKSGDMKSSDLTDLIQQFPELNDETDNLQQGLQKLATTKASDAIGKIRDSVKDTTDPKELAKADKYVQSILDGINTADFDMSFNDIKNLLTDNLIKNNPDPTIATSDKTAFAEKLMSTYANDETAQQAIIKLSMDPSMANASLDEWISKIHELRPQIELDISEKNLQDLSNELTRLQTDASNVQTTMDNKAAYNQKVTAADYQKLYDNGNEQIANLNKQIQEYQNEIDNTNKKLFISDEDNEKIKSYQDQIQAAQMSIENMKASQMGWLISSSLIFASEYSVSSQVLLEILFHNKFHFYVLWNCLFLCKF